MLEYREEEIRKNCQKAEQRELEMGFAKPVLWKCLVLCRCRPARRDSEGKALKEHIRKYLERAHRDDRSLPQAASKMIALLESHLADLEEAIQFWRANLGSRLPLDEFPQWLWRPPEPSPKNKPESLPVGSYLTAVDPAPVKQRLVKGQKVIFRVPSDTSAPTRKPGAPGAPSRPKP